MKNVLSGFKEFIARGNAIDLAVGVVIGAAFSTVITAIVDGLISPLIAAIFGQTDLTDLWDVTLRDDAMIRFGVIFDAALKFLFVAAAVYFVIVLPMNALAARRARGEEPEPAAPAEDVVLLTEIRDLLRRQA